MNEQTRTADGWTGYSQTDLAWFAEHYADTDWMVHVVGPDDCLAEDDNGQPFNELEAHMAAKGINEMYASLVARDPSPYNPFLHATVFHCGVPVADAEGEPASAAQVPGQQEIPAGPDPAADDAPSCRDCGTWPCARHATDADKAEHAAAESGAGR